MIQLHNYTYYLFTFSFSPTKKCYTYLYSYLFIYLLYILYTYLHAINWIDFGININRVKVTTRSNVKWNQPLKAVSVTLFHHHRSLHVGLSALYYSLLFHVDTYMKLFISFIMGRYYFNAMAKNKTYHRIHHTAHVFNQPSSVSQVWIFKNILNGSLVARIW